MPRLPGRIHSERFTEAKFRPYVTTIGRLVLTWNALHEDLASVFCQLIASKDEISRSLAIWHSASFDRPKRAMLRGATEAEKHLNRIERNKLDDIVWLLNEVDKLEDARNDAVHSPLLLLGYGPLAVYSGAANTIIPDLRSKNPRALKLVQKDVLDYFRWTAKAIVRLRNFAAAVDSAWDGRKPWPDRPSPLPRPEKRKNPWERYQAP